MMSCLTLCKEDISCISYLKQPHWMERPDSSCRLICTPLRSSRVFHLFNATRLIDRRLSLMYVPLQFYASTDQSTQKDTPPVDRACSSRLAQSRCWSPSLQGSPSQSDQPQITLEFGIYCRQDDQRFTPQDIGVRLPFMHGIAMFVRRSILAHE